MKTPKSLLLLLSSFLIYDFYTTFYRGLKVRLFAFPEMFGEIHAPQTKILE